MKIKRLLISVLLLLLASCSGDDSDLVTYISGIKLKKNLNIAPIPQFAPLISI